MTQVKTNSHTLRHLHNNTLLPSQTELAMQEFISRVNQMSGIEVFVHECGSPVEQSVIVRVASIMSPEARNVVRLQGEMYEKYPGARVRVDVTESRWCADSIADFDHVDR